MIQDVVSVHEYTTVKDVLALFVKHRIGGVPVVDDFNHLIGMLSDGDVLRYLSPKDESIRDLWMMAFVIEGETIEDVLKRKIERRVYQMMKRKPVVYVSAEDDFEDAIRLLSKHHFKKLPVVDDHHCVIGVVSRGDIMVQLSKKIIS